MAIEITGKVIKKLDVQKGESARGPWQKGGFVIETESSFPKKICCTAWGDLLNQVDNLNQGDRVAVSIDIESREYNERWYTDIKAWQIRPAGDTGDSNTTTSGGQDRSDDGAQAVSNASSEAPQEDDNSDDLPF